MQRPNYQLPARLLLAIALGSVSSSARAGDDWPQFRGPNCTGISTAAKPLPVEVLGDRERRAGRPKWATASACAVVAAGRVFVSGMTGDETVSLFAFDAATGKKLWQRDWPTGDARRSPQDEQPGQHHARGRRRARLLLFQHAGPADRRRRNRRGRLAAAAADAVLRLQVGAGHVAGAVSRPGAVLPGRRSVSRRSTRSTKRPASSAGRTIGSTWR